MNIEAVAAQVREKLAASGFDRSVKFDLGESGTILVNGSDISMGDGDAECTITIDADDFAALLAGDLNPTMAFMTGKMKIDGDMSAAMALSQVI